MQNCIGILLFFLEKLANYKNLYYFCSELANKNYLEDEETIDRNLFNPLLD